MLSEIIRELTKIQENTEVASEKVETQRAQSAIMNSLIETKEFDIKNKENNIQRQSKKAIHTHKNTC